MIWADDFSNLQAQLTGKNFECCYCDLIARLEVTLLTFPADWLTKQIRYTPTTNR